MVRELLLITILIVALSCNSTKSTSTNTTEESKIPEGCSELVTAKDFSGLDGCTMMFINANGEKLLLAENIPGYEIEAGKKYSIGYVVLEGMASICMAEDYIIKLSCIEMFGEQSIQACLPSENGIDNSFLKSLIDKNEVARIERFNYGTGFAYKVNSPYKSWLYNCRGKELCAGDLKTFSECFATFRPELKNPKIIFQAEGPKE